jgi:protein arginine kinase activator
MERCEECGKNDATVHITQIVQEQTTLRHLCEACARKAGIAVEPVVPVFKPAPAAPEDPGADETISCPNCSLTYKEFKDTGWLGCPQCYQAFSVRIEELFYQVHGATRHTGKSYKSSLALPADLKQLKVVLARALKNEEYELAAAIRDAIHNFDASVKT